MNPWQILEIPRSSDAREIKRAYAKKLKLTKPDEKPAEFQVLHEAYKTALDIASRRKFQEEQRASEPAENSNSNLNIPEANLESDFAFEKNHEHDDEQMNSATKSHAQNNANLSGTTVTSTASDEQIIVAASVEQHVASADDAGRLSEEQKEAEGELRRQEYQRLVAEVETMLEARTVPSDEAEWHFLTSTPYLLEEEFNWFLGRQIFKLFADYCQTRIRARGSYYNREIPINVVQYCDQLFSWRNNAYYLQQEFGESLCRPLFDQLDTEHHHDNTVQGVRGGKLIQAAPSSKPKPQETNDEGFNYWYIVFGAIVVTKILAYLSNNS